MQTISRQSGISRTTIFNRFSTRTELLEALAKDTLNQIGLVMKMVPSGKPDDIEAVMLEVTQQLMSLGPRTVFLQMAPVQATPLDPDWSQAFTPLAIYFGTAQHYSLLRNDQPVRWLVAAYVGLLFAAWDEIAIGELGKAQASRLIVQTWLDSAKLSNSKA